MRRYLETGIRGGCYDEFQRGEWDGSHWKADSVYLYDDVFDELGLYGLFVGIIGGYDRWGPNRIAREQWERIADTARAEGGGAAELIDELSPWAEENFSEHEAFTIIGV